MIENNPLLNHAEELLRRVSPEGRARARRLRERRKRAFNRLMLRIAVVAIAVLAATATFGLLVAPVSDAGELLAVAIFAMISLVIILASRERPALPETNKTIELTLIPQRTEQWLETQRPALPPPAARMLDAIGGKLESL